MSTERIDLAELKRLLKHLPARDPKTPIVGGGHTLREVIVVARDALQLLADRDAEIVALREQIQQLRTVLKDVRHENFASMDAEIVRLRAIEDAAQEWRASGCMFECTHVDALRAALDVP